MKKSFFNVENKQDYCFDQLPIGAQKAIAGRWFIECGVFLGGEVLSEVISEYIPDSANEENYAQVLSDWQWESILALIAEYYEETIFVYFEAPTELVKQVILEHNEGLEDYTCWEDYAKDYGGEILHKKENRFACLSGMGDSEVFEDGWNRLHSYINQGHETIPIVEY